MYFVIRGFCIACCFFLISNSSAQTISIQYYHADPYNLTFEDCWKFNIVNNGPEVDVYVRLSVKEVSSGVIFSARTPSFKLSSGIFSFESNPQIMRSATLQTNNLGINSVSFNHSLPIGEYEICVEVFNNGSENIASECIERSIRIPAPPHLISPLNEEVVVEQRPYLVWSPPTVFQSCDITYRLLLTPLKDGVSPRAAVYDELHSHAKSGIPHTMEQYPLAFPELKDGETYAWTIVARCNDKLIPAVEVHTFTYAPPRKNEDSIMNAVIRLSQSSKKSEIYPALRNQVYFSLDNYYSSENLDYKIFNSSGEEVLDESDLEVEKVVTGNNQFVLDLNCMLQVPGIYRLVVQTPANKQLSVEFQLFSKELRKAQCE